MTLGASSNTSLHLPLLSVCIPTFNRRDALGRLVDKFRHIDGVEVCVYVDGSTDGTVELLHDMGLNAPCIRVANGENRGRASALLGAISLATAPFVMLFDDDDDVCVSGVEALLPLLKDLPADTCGYICHMNDEHGKRLGTAFPMERSNFLKLRFDQGVVGDKKEVVRTDLLRTVLYDVPRGVRRSPTSLLWIRLALLYDVVCVDLVLGVKRYLPEGYTKTISRLKLDNPVPMRRVNQLRVHGYFRGRYRSITAMLRSLAAMGAYAVYACFHAARQTVR